MHAFDLYVFPAQRDHFPSPVVCERVLALRSRLAKSCFGECGSFSRPPGRLPDYSRAHGKSIGELTPILIGCLYICGHVVGTS